jgi:hypothetical protein
VEASRLNYGLGFNINETIREVVKKSVQAEQLGLDYVWVSDTPAQRYAFTVASAIAAHTKTLRIGLGLLSCFLYTPEQVADGFSTLTEAYGDRFEFLIGPGDRYQLQRVGVSLFHPKGTVDYILDSKNKIEKRLRENKVRGKVWLGAQGPKMLGIARFFDGVLLNYASPEPLKWALSKVGKVSQREFQLGVYAPSYVYSDYNKEVYNLLRTAATVVAVGASPKVLKRFRMREKIVAVKEKMKAGFSVEFILNEVPSEIVDVFSIYKSTRELKSYLAELSQLGIKHIVFSYPQNFSEKTIRDLAKALF